MRFGDADLKHFFSTDFYSIRATLFFKTNYNIYSLIIWILKCSNTYSQKTPGHPCGRPINVPAPYVRQWYELLNRLHSQRAYQRSA